jgi:uncharacterized Zn finger protein (UPF0148 family)
MKGSKASCPVCGYRVEQMKVDLKTPRALKQPEVQERKAWAPPIPDQRGEPVKEAVEVKRAEVAPVVRRRVRFGHDDEGRSPLLEDKVEAEEDDPTVVRGCSYCKARPDARCFFCQSPICRSHTDRLQIHVRSTAFGDLVKACPTCSGSKDGRNPTPAEAEEAGMLFSIKPYHVWTRMK